MLKQVLLPSKGKYHLSIPSNNGINPPLRLLSAFQSHYVGKMPEYIVQATGREMWVAAITDQTPRFDIYAADLNRQARFTRRSARAKQTHIRRPLPAWARYPAGVIARLCDDGLHLNGVQAVVVGAEAHGPRYDFSMGLAFATLWHEVHGADYDEERLIALVEAVRRDYIDA